MAHDDPESKSLQDLERRLREARGGGSREKPSEPPPSNIGIAFRMSTELVAAVVVGGGIGWALDKVFKTSPVLLIVMFCFGVAAGFRNVARAAREMNKNIDGH
jgi:ATP synthase protein I